MGEVDPVVRDMLCIACGTSSEPLYEAVSDHWYGVEGVWAERRCVGCATLLLSPRPDRDEVPHFYTNYHTHRERPSSLGVAARVKRSCYGAMHRLPLAMGRVRRSAIVGHVGPPARQGAIAVDVGCGAGDGVQGLATLGYHAIGIDFDPVTLSGNAWPGACADGEALPFRSGQIDVVLLSHVVEHAVDPSALLHEVRRVIRPDGTIVILTPNAGSVMSTMWGPAWRGLEAPRHLQVLSPDGLRCLAERAGLQVLKMSTSERLAAEIFVASARAAAVSTRGRWSAVDGAIAIGRGVRAERNERRSVDAGRPVGEEIHAVLAPTVETCE